MADIIPTPQPVQSGAYTYGDKGLALNGVPRASLDHLKSLVSLYLTSAQVRTTTKAWVMAQLELYGVQFKKSEKAFELKMALRAAVKAGKGLFLFSSSVSCGMGANSVQVQQPTSVHRSLRGTTIAAVSTTSRCL